MLRRCGFQSSSCAQGSDPAAIVATWLTDVQIRWSSPPRDGILVTVTDTTDLSRQLGAALGDGYAVERTLGEGGFAVVFLVRDLSLKRNLAVKVLAPDMIASATALGRFRREAETVAQ